MKRTSWPVRFPEYPAEVADHVVGFCDLLQDRGYVPLSGRHRIAMIAPCLRMVVKVPHCDAGMTANHQEADAWRRHLRDPLELPVAGCRIFFADPAVGVPMLAMRHVDTAFQGDAPSWASLVDCGQYGRDRFGRIVAYDL